MKNSVCLVLILVFGGTVFGQIGSVPYIAINQAEVDGRIWNLSGNGVADDTAKLQAAITYAMTHQRTLLLRRPSVAYRITSTLDFGDGLSTWYGFDFKGVGLPRILWAGGAAPMFDCDSLAESRFESLWLDGGTVAGTTGIYVHAAHPGQHVQFRNLTVQNCPVRGFHFNQTVGATCDYFDLDMCAITTCGTGVYVQGGVRQINISNGSIVTCTTYGLNVFEGHVNLYGTCFAWNTSGSFYIGSNLASLASYGSYHEDHPILTGGGTWNVYSALTADTVLNGLTQDMYTLPFPAGPAVDYNAGKGLILVGCKFVQSVNIGADVPNVQSISTDFVPFAISGVNADFTGLTSKVARFGDVRDELPDIRLGSLYATLGDSHLDKPVELEFDGSWDGESWPLPIQMPIGQAVTLTHVYAYAVGSDTPTLTFNLEERAAGTINTPGVDIFAAPVTATAAGVDLSAFANAGLAAGSHIWWKTGDGAATGTVDAIKLVFKAN